MIDWKQKDKQGHAIVGFLISFGAGVILAPICGLGLGVLAGLLKEIWDGFFPEKHTQDLADFLATAIGAVAGAALAMGASL